MSPAFPEDGVPWGPCAAVVGLNAVVVATALLVGPSPATQFDESGFVTDVSAGYLLATAVFSCLTFRSRRAVSRRGGGSSSGARVWLLVGGAFVFLALDELAKLHESFDKRMHEYVLGFAPTHLSSRLDDGLVAIYGVGAVVVCWRYRRELLGHRPTRILLMAGLAFFFAHLAADLLNHADVRAALHRAGMGGRRLGEWMTVVEETLKTVGGSCFAASTFVAWRSARAEGTEAETGGGGGPPSEGP